MACKAAKKLDDAARKATSKLDNLALKKNQLVTKAANKLDDAVMKGSKKLGDTIDQMRHIMNQLTPQPALAMAGGGSLDDIGSTADKIQDAYNNLKRTMKIDKTGAGNGVRVSGVVKEEVIEDIKSVEEKVSGTLDNVEREVGDTLKGKSKIINTVRDLTQDMIVYRGTSTEALGNLKNLSPEDLVGEKFIEPGFMSTSMNSSVASDTFCGNMQIKIEASKGARALDISSISEYSSEAEILFNAGQEMLITSAESRNGVLYITVIAE